MRILYVEDNPANLFLVQRVARMGNHEVLNYTTGETALENFERDHPDLVLMDVQLAGNMTGLDVVRKLRGSGYRIPIIAVTAYAMVGDRDRCMDAGCDDYLAKPLPVPKLVEIIKRYDPMQQDKSADAITPATQPNRPTTEMPTTPVTVPQAKPHEPAAPKPVETAPAAPTATPTSAESTTAAPSATPVDGAMPSTTPSAEEKPKTPETPVVDVKKEDAVAVTPVEVKVPEIPAPAVMAAVSAVPAPTVSAAPVDGSMNEADVDPDAKTEPFKPLNMPVTKEDKA